MGNDLDGLPQVIAAAFLGDDLGVDRPGGRVGHARQRLVDETLVVTEVEVGLSPVVGDEDLTVFAGVHRAGINVEVGVKFAHRDFEAT